MKRTSGFLQWIEESFTNIQEFRPTFPGELPYAQYFDLSFKRKGSFMKGNQWYFFKRLPSNLTSEAAQHLWTERNQVLKGKGKILKLLVDFMVFFYISEVSVSPNVLDSLGNFYSVKKSVFQNVHEVNFFLDTSTGQYTQPQRTGYFGWIPLKKLIREVETFIFEPYNQWLQSNQGTTERIVKFCHNCGQNNPEGYKYCGKCGANLIFHTSGNK
ncbi:MAG: zinc ribbon domain-containing protein [Promethearchaeota archaeon]